MKPGDVILTNEPGTFVVKPQIPKPIGARILVIDVEPIDEVTDRAKRAGLYVVTLEMNKPKPTTGKVVAIGNDPLVQECFKLGQTVFFQKHAGTYIIVEGIQYRSLEMNEVISVME